MRFKVIRTTYVDALTRPEAIAAASGRVHDEVEAHPAPWLGSEPVMPSAEKEWWTTKDVARYLHVKGATISNYHRRKQMPAAELTVGRTHAWRPKTILEWRPPAEPKEPS